MVPVVSKSRTVKLSFVIKHTVKADVQGEVPMMYISYPLCCFYSYSPWNYMNNTACHTICLFPQLVVFLCHFIFSFFLFSSSSFPNELRLLLPELGSARVLFLLKGSSSYPPLLNVCSWGISDRWGFLSPFLGHLQNHLDVTIVTRHFINKLNSIYMDEGQMHIRDVRCKTR